ncbi:hypothetical protein [Streptomyces sp. NPDC001678]|uniref:hypothetical protein n=1 Tax=Streptomyces sp. NPDC001678 TaxID=3364599 RepID=UPI003683EC3E
MPDPTPYPVLLADNIARQLGLLAQHLAQAPPEQTAQILGRALDVKNGILGQVTAPGRNRLPFHRDSRRARNFPA